MSIDHLYDRDPNLNQISPSFLVGPSLIQEAAFVELPTLIAIVVSCIVAGLFAVLLLMFCRCKRKQSKESAKAKEYDIDSIHPSIVAQQNQAPPPYYSASSLENKALEHSMDLAMDQNQALYASQQTYGYHQQNAMMPQVPQNDCKYPTIPPSKTQILTSNLLPPS